MSSTEITVVIVDDHAVVRQGLRAVLESEAGIQVLGEAGDGAGAIKMIEELKPQVAVVDLAMPGIGGLEVLRRIRDTKTQTQIVVLSMYSDKAFALEALGFGAMGYVSKDANSSEVVKAVREAARGRRYTTIVTEEEVRARFDKRGASDPFEMLSPREREVICLAAEGLTNNDIGDKLFISPRTAEIHRGAAMKKLGLRTHVELVLYAIRRGLLPSEER